jgi:hypothetical protein
VKIPTLKSIAWIKEKINGNARPEKEERRIDEEIPGERD